jgi:hemoglobin
MEKLNEIELRNWVSKLNKVFYDKIYADPWLKKMFFMIDQRLIEAQQTDFMVGALGGPKNYSGRSPKDAHPHLYITEEIWLRREVHLKEAFAETQFPADLAEKWLRIDESFKRAIVKTSIDECQKRFYTDEVISIEKKVA